MDKHVLVGIDIGTTTIKAVLISARHNRVLASEGEEITPIQPRPDWMEYDPEEWWRLARLVTSRAMCKAGVSPYEIAGIALGGFTVGGLMVDKAGQPLMNCTHYNDMRHAAQVERLRSEIGELVIQRSGNQISFYNGLPKQVWFHDETPELFGRSHKLLTEAGYIGLKLTGEYAISRPEAGFYGQYDFRTRDWNDDILRRAGIPREMMPRIVDAWEEIGRVMPSVAADIGVAPGTPVFAGADDASPVALTTGAIEPGQCYLSIGSSSNVVANLKTPAYDPTCLFYPHCMPDMYMFITVLSATGASYKWARNQLSPLETAAAQLTGMEAYDMLGVQAARARPGSGGLVFLPYLEGEFTPVNDFGARGVFFGISGSTSRDEVLRAVLEGVAFSILHNVETIERQGNTLSELMLTGGLTRSKLWLQILADITGKPVSLPEENHGAPFGYAMLAGIGAGLFSDAREAVSRMVKVDRHAYEPRREHAAMYEDMYALYKSLYPALKDNFAQAAQLRARHFE